MPDPIYVLPDLPYDYGALEPHISGRIMELHHDKHHRKYVDTANEIIEKLLAARKKSDFAGSGRKAFRRAGPAHRARLRQLRQLQETTGRDREHGDGLRVGDAGLGSGD